MQDLIKDITKHRRPCYFISPHLDDVVLSCGELLRELAGKTPVTVITVFTKAAAEKPTLSARKAVAVTGFPTGAALYAARRKEDLVALNTVGIQAKHLGEVEALWRRKQHGPLRRWLGRILPEVVHLYPTYRLHIASGHVASSDAQTVDRIAAKLKRHIPEDAVVFAPLGIGGHVDHLVTRQAVERIVTPVYWYDQPYYFRLHGQKRPGSQRSVQELRPKKPKKAALAAYYRTQISLLFPDGAIPELREFYTRSR